jgi:hypothetical protein
MLGKLGHAELAADASCGLLREGLQRRVVLGCYAGQNGPRLTAGPAGLRCARAASWAARCRVGLLGWIG